MECERCHQRPATVHLTEIINNQKRTMRLCEQCAREVQAESLGFLPQMNLHSFLASLLHNEFGAPAFGQAVVPERTRCPACGVSEAQFAKRGLLGCADCYHSFGGRLEPVLRRIHGTNRHTGKVPRRTGGKVRVTSQIERLKAKLKEAISREEFEQAAQLRDKIRELEKQL
ncbi:MAG: UvrB/UvrC motif-containing protein [Armatimonadetes bacterium]|nr:UvrB/UvrC motif-containing protein [Armatimonadota bacterium]